MQLKPEETDLIGQWKVVNGSIVEDATSERIKYLVDQYLEKVAGGGWETLYRDPIDGRYWELTYPQGEMHGGGPPRLTYLSGEAVKKRYSELS
jgi:hypothetical protein